MGHDAWIFALPAAEAGHARTMTAKTLRDIESRLGKLEEVCYWRRHNGIGIWMAKLYIEKGGILEGELYDFGAKGVRLSRTDLNRFKFDLLGGKINDSQMLFNNALTLIKFIPAAKSALRSGKALFYFAF